MSDHHNGLECVKLVKEFLAENEVIEPLILVLKHFLKTANFNDPYFGGLSSYALFLMIVSYMQGHHIPKTISQVNLGHLLLDFLYFYGHFDHETTGISTCLPGKKSEKPN
jgi:DNA polymerase sigma